MKIAYIGSIVDAEDKEFTALSVAGNKYQKGITSSWETNRDCELFNVLPYASFPRSKIIFVGNKKNKKENVHIAFYINILLIKQITCLISLFFLLAKWAISNRHENRKMVIYNLLSFEALPVLWISCIFRIEKIAIIADMSPEKPIGILAKLESCFEKTTVKKFNKLIVITKYIMEDLVRKLMISKNLMLKVSLILYYSN